VWKKLKGWKEKTSFAGSGIFIKVVVQAIPMYIMSCFMQRKGLCKHMEHIVSNFWRGSKRMKEIFIGENGRSFGNLSL